MSTVIGLLPNDEHVDHACEACRAAGIPAAKISVFDEPADAWRRLGRIGRLGAILRKDTYIGLTFGLVVGLLYGIPALLLNCIWGECSLSAGLIGAALITLFWVFGGGLIGALLGEDQLERDLEPYVDAVRHGAALVVVRATPAQARRAAEALAREDGRFVQDINSGAHR